ncbi:disulfide bond formation protein DsbA [Sphingomonas sp. Leaf412]|uniref:DsbA family oxidoreductase n=1 Tax=Sphingomonas sp. Leaf412 TaxID=1736370 RepID=UPI0006F37E52|nr:DsbA family oxidoreductase [Sphingomonas sp. Leaf412]KQT35342.1 disulfide bond formation protein DsbA [Sphingomonas sp. Leaf412]
MTRPMQIDFVSDVSCPWCVIGLRGLEQALRNVGDLVDVDLRFRPFELNPHMPAEGQEIGEHIRQKYGSTREQSAANRTMIRERAAELGFTMTMGEGSRIYNTFDAHRLLHWAGIEGRQRQLKHKLFEAYFTDGQNPGDVDVLVAAAEAAGLDGAAAREVITSGCYADNVRADEQLWRAEGVSAVPTVIVNRKYVITGGQPPAAFEKALRSIAAEA